MTTPNPARLIEGTLADLRTLMGRPVGLRRGNTYLVPLPNPAAGSGLVYKVDAAFWEHVVSLLFTFTASAAAGLRSLSIALANSDGTPFNITPAGPSILAGQTWQISADMSEGPFSFAGPSQDATGSVTSPAALGTVVSLGTVPAGEYVINWTVGLGGTLGAADRNNFALVVGGNTIATSVNEPVAGEYPQPAETVDIPAGGTTILIQAIALGTVGAIYSATVTVSQITAGIACPQLPDIVLKAGYQLQINGINLKAADQISGVQLLTERYPSNWADGSLESDLEGLLELLER